MPSEAHTSIDILFLTHNMAGLGGSYMRSFSLARELACFGQRVTLFAGRSEPGLRVRAKDQDGVQVVEQPDLFPRAFRHGGLSPMDVLWRTRRARSGRFDIVHAFDQRPAVCLPAFAARSRGGLFVSDWADLWGREGIGGQPASALRTLLGRLDGYLEQKVRREADAVTAITSELDGRAAVLGVPEDRRLILPPGAPVDWIGVLDKQSARGMLGLPVQARIVGYGGYAPYDRDFTRQVVLELLKTDPGLLVVSTGARVPGLQAAADVAGVGERLVQFGSLPLDRMSRVLAACDLLMLPYLDTPVNRGRFPNKFGDYLAAGRAVITHQTGDLGRLVAREKLAVLSRQEPQAFAAAAINLLCFPSALDDLGSRARQFAERQWSWRQRAQELLAFYRRLLG